jgi:hypothetical protein
VRFSLDGHSICSRHSTQEITLENPLDEQITFQTTSSNKNNFSVNTDQEALTMQSKSQAKVNVVFNPSSIGSGTEQQPHQSTISFVNEKVCQWKEKEKLTMHIYIY